VDLETVKARDFFLRYVSMIAEYLIVKLIYFKSRWSSLCSCVCCYRLDVKNPYILIYCVYRVAKHVDDSNAAIKRLYAKLNTIKLVAARRGL